MNFYFEMVINALDVTLILSFLIQYFGYKLPSAINHLGTSAIWCISFVILGFFSWTHSYENYASLLQILINIIFCCIFLQGSILKKYLYLHLQWGL